jgi:hypothetical protein
VAALVAVRGLGTGEEDIVPAPIPTTATPADAEPGARGRARTRPRAEQAAPAKPAPAKPAEQAGQSAAPKPGRKLGAEQVAKLKDDALLATVAKALGQDDVVVLFFTRPGAADDTGARSAVRELRGTKGVQVFSPRFQALDEYRPVLAGAGVSQVPAIVIAKPGQKAQVVEGYVDRQSLRQQVEDALR